MKRILVILGILVAAFLLIGAQLTLRRSTSLTDIKSGTYADAQVDTLTWIRAGNEGGATFWLHGRDSVNIVDVIVRRQFNGALIAAVAGDTILGASSSDVDAGALFQATLPLTPYTDTLLVFVTYQDSLNGVTSNSVMYGIAKANR